MRLGLLSTLTAALCCSSLGSAQNLSRVHPALLAGTQTDSQGVIVLYKSEAAPDAGTRIARRHNVKLQSHFRSTGISTFRLTRKEIRELADDPEIAYIAPDRTVRAASLDRGAEAVGAYQAQSYGFTGAGVGVAFIDSGVSYHTCDWNDNCQAPNTRYLAQVSFVTDLNGSWTAPDDGQDYYGHGTHVASIAGGAGTFSTAYVNQWNIYPNYWIRGVAPGINIVSLRVLDADGVGRDSSVIAALDWTIENKDKYNLRIVNLSIGRPFSTGYENDPLCQAAERAWKAGLVVVVAAGNMGRENSLGEQGYGTITAPGNDPYVITVGAVNTFGRTERRAHKVASYSSKGPTAIDHVMKPDLVAPGNNILASQCLLSDDMTPCPLVAANHDNAVPDSDYADITGGVTSTAYFRLSGTSMAAPVVTGAVALMLEKTPTLTPDQVKARLLRTARRDTFVASYTANESSPGDKFLVTHDPFTIGAGELDIVAALNSTDAAPETLTAASPVALCDSSNRPVGISAAAGTVWTSTDLAGASAIWGTATAQGSTANWASDVLFGVLAPQGATAVWSASAVWGTSVAAESSSMSVLTKGDR